MKKILIGLFICLALSTGCVRSGFDFIDNMYYNPEDKVEAGDGWGLEWSEKRDTFTSKTWFYEILDNDKLSEDPSLVIIVEMPNCTKEKKPQYKILSAIQLPEIVLYSEDLVDHKYKLHLTKIDENMYSINNFEAEIISDGNGIIVFFWENGKARIFYGKFCNPSTVDQFVKENRVCHRDSSVKDVLDNFFETTNKAYKKAPF